MKNSAIEWTDHTFNPWIGCTQISAGCRDCYAKRDFCDRKGLVEWGGGKDRHRTSAATWRQPYLWNAEAKRTGKRPRVFCASLADVFDPEVPDRWRDDLFDVIDECRHLQWLILTKRPLMAKTCLRELEQYDWPWKHVGLGVSIEDNAAARSRITELLGIPAAFRFVSVEPMLEHLNVQIAPSCDWAVEHGSLIGVDWVICGGESGHKARPTHPAWVRALRDQCVNNGRPFFFKSWGEWVSLGQWPSKQAELHVFQDGLAMHRVGRKASGCLVDGVEWKEVPLCLS